MILLDANLLLYATISDFEQHGPARAWLDDQLNAPARVGLPWPTLLAFLRISTNPRIFPRPMAMTEAWGRVVTWLDLPNVWMPEPTERHRELLDSFLTGNAGASKLVADAHLAAIAVSHGLVLCSTDGDFARFKALRWENPLASWPCMTRIGRILTELTCRSVRGGRSEDGECSARNRGRS